jgi:hypothetical protein
VAAAVVERQLAWRSAVAVGLPQVGYCQGMAFPAGVLLMYLPEEHAFRCEAVQHHFYAAGSEVSNTSLFHGYRRVLHSSICKKLNKPAKHLLSRNAVV